ncbi:MAG: molybdate ABC transporter permease subunit [Rhodothermus sp.]|nr:molybdate ABC transporter permease subunit [Rhodothermus sp.]
MDWTAAWVTLRLALWTTGLLFVLGLPLAYWLATTHFPGRGVIGALVTLPLVLPPTVVGFYVLVATAPDSLIGQLLALIGVDRLAFTFPGIVLGSVLFNLPFAVRPFTAAFQSVDRRLIEAAWCLGVSRWRAFTGVMLPLAWPGILTGLVLTFAHSLGEFGVVLMVGGNIPGVTRTLSIAIYDEVQALNYAAADRMALLLVVFAVSVLTLVYLLERKGLRRWV